MTIREKLCIPIGRFYTETSKELEEIADNYAIDFSAWLFTRTDINLKNKNLNELLEIFKKEKGL